MAGDEDDDEKVLDRDNFLAFILTMTVLVLCVIGTSKFYHQILHPTAITGGWKILTAIIGACIAWSATATLLLSMVTFFAIDRKYMIRRFHETLGQRAGYALIVATFIALRAVVFEALKTHQTLDVVDDVGRITAIVTVVAIATCLRPAVRAARAATHDILTNFSLLLILIGLGLGLATGLTLFKMMMRS